MALKVKRVNLLSIVEEDMYRTMKKTAERKPHAINPPMDPINTRTVNKALLTDVRTYLHVSFIVKIR